MSEDRDNSTILFLIGALIGAGMSAFIVHDAVMSVYKDDAVKHGKAEYYLDDHNARQWRWKP